MNEMLNPLCTHVAGTALTYRAIQTGSATLTCYRSYQAPIYPLARLRFVDDLRIVNEMLNPLCIPVAGTVWTYGIYGDYSSDTTAENYCHNTAYMVAFVLITIAWCIIGLALALSFCACCCACIAMCLTAK